MTHILHIRICQRCGETARMLYAAPTRVDERGRHIALIPLTDRVAYCPCCTTSSDLEQASAQARWEAGVRAAAARDAAEAAADEAARSAQQRAQRPKPAAPRARRPQRTSIDDLLAAL